MTPEQKDRLRRQGVILNELPAQQYIDNPPPQRVVPVASSASFEQGMPPPPSSNPIPPEVRARIALLPPEQQQAAAQEWLQRSAAERSQHIQSPITQPNGVVGFANPELARAALERRRQATPAQEAAPEQPQEDASGWSTFGSQLWGNARNIGQGAADLVSEGADLASSYMNTDPPGYEPPSFEEWAAKNAAFKMDQIKQASFRASNNVEGVSRAEGARIRDNERQKAERLQSEIEADYKAAVEAGRQQHASHLDKRFSDRYPMIDAAGKIIPATAAALLFRRALKHHKNDVLKLTDNINSKNMTGSRLRNAKESLAALEASGRKNLAFGLGGAGVSATAVPQFVQNLVDRNLPEGSAAREEARYAYSPLDKEGNFNYDGLKRTVSDAASRAALVASTMLGVGGLTAPQLTAGQREAARRAAGVRDVKAFRTKVQDNDEIVKLRQQKREADAQNRLHSAVTRHNTNRRIVNDFEGRPPATGTVPIRSNLPVNVPASEQARMLASDRLNKVNRKAMLEEYIAKNGNVTTADLKRIAPNLSERTLVNYLQKVEIQSKMMFRDPEKLRQAFDNRVLSVGLPAAGAAGIAASGGINPMMTGGKRGY